MTEATATTFEVKQSVEIDAPRERVFGLAATPEGIAKWAPYTNVEPRVGGRYDFGEGRRNATGEVTELDPPRLIAYTWDWLNPAARRAHRGPLRATRDRGAGTVLHLTHIGLPNDEQRQSHDHGWSHYAGRVKDVAEGRDPGPDTMGEQ